MIKAESTDSNLHDLRYVRGSPQLSSVPSHLPLDAYILAVARASGTSNAIASSQDGGEKTECVFPAVDSDGMSLLTVVTRADCLILA